MPEPKQIYDATLAVATSLTKLLPEMLGVKRIGFAIYIFEYEAGGNLSYASNAAREDVITMMKEWLARVETESSGVPEPIE